MSEQIYSIPVTKIDGTVTRLSEFEGKTLLIVNVASKCGLTPQYAGLEKLYEDYRSKDFEVLGFPANNFLGQEPGTDEERRSKLFARPVTTSNFRSFQKYR